MMIFLLGLLASIIYIMIDAINQGRSGASEYVPNNEFLNVLSIILIVAGSYSLFYFVTVFIYIFKRSKRKDNSIEMNLNNKETINDEEIRKLSKKMDINITNEENNSNVRHIVVIDKPFYSKGIIYKYVLFMTSSQFLLFLLVSLAFIIISIPLFFVSFFLFLVFIIIGGILLLTTLFIFLFLGPNKYYERVKANLMPISFKIFDDKIEQTNLLVDGQEIRFICRFDNCKTKEIDNYIFIRNKNGKVIVGMLIDKSKMKEEAYLFLNERIKNKR